MDRIISCFTNSYGRFGPQAAFEWLPQAGIEYVELAIKTAGVPSFFKETPVLTNESTPAELEQVREQIARNGLKLSSCNITSGNPLDPVVVDVTIRKLELAGKLGVSLVVAGAGEVTNPSEKAQLYENLKRIGDAAAEQGITYCCETHPGVCQNADRMVETMQQVDHPNVAINFDTGNLFFYNEQVDLMESLRQVLPYVRHVHLKDTPGEFEKWHFAELGSGGAVDFIQLREILDESGFHGPYSLEIEGIAREPELSLDGHHQRIVKSVAYLQQCGYFD